QTLLVALPRLLMILEQTFVLLHEVTHNPHTEHAEQQKARDEEPAVIHGRGMVHASNQFNRVHICHTSGLNTPTPVRPNHRAHLRQKRELTENKVSAPARPMPHKAKLLSL